MLILSRRLNEKIVFPAFHTTIEVVAVKGGVVRLGIQAPPEVIVLREELQERPPAAEGRSAEVEETEARVSAQPHKSKALLVEDNPNERELLATFLRLAGVDVDMAGDGADALDYLHSHDRPAVMLLDMGLPRCDGATTVREIRRDPAYAGLKIFAITGHAQDEFDLARGPAGVDRWFLKPVDLNVLLRDLNLDLDCALSNRV